MEEVIYLRRDTIIMEQAVLDDVMEKIMTYSNEKLVFYLMFLFSPSKIIPQNLILRLSEEPRFIERIAEIYSKSKYYVLRSIVRFVQAAYQLVAEKPSTTKNVQNMINNITKIIKFDSDGVDAIFREMFIKNKIKRAVVGFLASFCQIFELYYPDAFDRQIEKLKQVDDKKFCRALHFLLSWPFIMAKL